MAFKIIFSEDVPADLQQNIDWYNERTSGLGNKFYKAVRSQIQHIKKAPLSIAIRYDVVRCAPVKGFPFLVHFTVNSDTATIKVLAVFSSH